MNNQETVMNNSASLGKRALLLLAMGLSGAAYATEAPQPVLPDSLYIGGDARSLKMASDPAASGGGILAGDFDGDGDIDLLGSSASGAQVFYQNDGRANFTQLALSNAASPFRGLKSNPHLINTSTSIVADFDSDGDVDIWDYQGASREDGRSVYLENVNGHYVSSEAGGANPLAAASDPYHGVYGLMSGDFDSDGDVDLVRFDGKGYDSVTYYRNDGGKFVAIAGSDAASPFRKLKTKSEFVYLTTKSVVADFDNDGDLDIWDYEGATNSDGDSIYLENVDGATYVSSMADGANPMKGLSDPKTRISAFLVGDFDSDGDVDLISYDDTDYATTTFYQNNGHGEFSRYGNRDPNHPFNQLDPKSDFVFFTGKTLVADFDNDGDVDLWDYEGALKGDGNSVYLTQLSKEEEIRAVLYPEPVFKRWVVFATIGQAQGDDSASELNSQITAAGLNATSSTSDTTRVSWQVGVGYRFNSKLSAELGYVNLGDVETNFTGVASNVNTFLNTVSDIHPQTANGWRLTGAYRHPVSDKVNVAVRAGMFSWKSEYTLTAPGASSDISDSGTSATYGLGVEMEAFRPELLIGLNYDRYTIDGEEISVVGAGISYPFR